MVTVALSDNTVVTTIGLVIVAAIGAYSAWLQRGNGHVIRDSNHVIRDTHAQVVTLNESTIGELAAATEERRARSIPYEQRTVKEQRHIDDAPPKGSAQGPRLADRLKHVDERVEQVHHAVNGDLEEPKPSLYELMVDLRDRFVAQAERIDRLEDQIGLPPQ